MARSYDSHAITTQLGLPRPFDTYAPRTQRRYAAAYARGDQSFRETNTREYRQRISTDKQQALRSARTLSKGSGDRTGKYDKDTLNDFAAAAGWEEVNSILAYQVEARKEYKDTGSSASGSRRFYAMQREYYNEDTGDMFDATPYGYYH